MVLTHILLNDFFPEMLRLLAGGFIMSMVMAVCPDPELIVELMFEEFVDFFLVNVDLCRLLGYIVV